MKLLMFFAHDWWYRTAAKGLAEAPDAEGEDSVTKAAVIFFHCEPHDEADMNGVIRKFIKNAKWIAGKFSSRNVVLHSFNHLATGKSSADFAARVLEEVRQRLEGAGYSVMHTPFGYFNEFKMHVAGDSLAKVFKEF